MNLCVSSISDKSSKKLFAGKIFFSLFFCIVISVSAQDEYIDGARLSDQYTKKTKVSKVEISGNKKTKEKIIFRELTFNIGDSVKIKEIPANFERSKQNLINSSLFNFVTINALYTADSSEVTIQVDVQERWYLWPSPIFEIQDRNFNSWWATKDLFRINYGLYLTLENVRGRNESAVLKFRKGYTELYGFAYRIPYINKKQTIGANVSCNFLRNNEVAFSTYGNKLLFNRNYTRYMRKENEIKLGFTYRNGLYNRHALDILYCESSVADTITELNKSYFGKGQSEVNYFSLQYRVRWDYRDAKIFPLHGYLYECWVTKDGLNLLKNENVDNFSIDAVAKNYWSPMKRVFVGTALRLRYKRFNTSGYYFNKALGYNDFVRGYEYYVVDGQTFAMLKTNINYQLIKPRVVKLPLKRLEKFNKVPYALYTSIHCDAAFVQDNYFYADNPLANSWLGGAGAGISFVTYYDYVLRVEASMNRMRQKGIFLHFAAPL